MKISYAITVCNEIDEIKRLVPFLLKLWRLTRLLSVLLTILFRDFLFFRVFLYPPNISSVVSFNKLLIVLMWYIIFFTNKSFFFNFGNYFRNEFFIVVK